MNDTTNSDTTHYDMRDSELTEFDLPEDSDLDFDTAELVEGFEAGEL